MSLNRNSSHKIDILLLIVAGISLALFFAAKYGGMLWVRALFEQNKIVVLNHFLSVSPEKPSLTYYLGFAEKHVFGPASQVLIFLVLLIVGLRYLHNKRPFYFGLFIFIFLIISKFEVLFFPPYGDAIAGPFVEAWWLAKNHFNYVQLFHLPDYSQGGPRTYLFSIYPTYVAIWMTILRTPSLYLPVLHLFVFAMITAITTMLREISRKVLSDRTAFLLVAVFLAFPLTQSQSEALNMEAPCLFFIMWSAFFLVHRRVLPAMLAAFGAVLVKGTGIFACGAVGVVTFIFFVNEWRKQRHINWKYVLYMFFLIAIPCLKLFSKYLIHDSHTSAGMVGLFNGWPSFKTIKIVRWFGLSLVIYLGMSLFRFKKVKNSFYESNIMYLYGAAFFLLLLNFFAVSARYCFNVTPFLVFAGVYSFCLIIKSRRIQALVLVPIILWSAFISYGQFFGFLRDHVGLERSLEYRNDLYAAQETVRIIEKNYADFKIGAPIQYAQRLAIKEMGYVKKDLDVFIYGFPCKYGGIEEFSGLKNLNIRRTVFVGHGSDGDRDRSSKLVQEYPIDPRDQILKEVAFGRIKVWIFMGGIAIEKLHRTIGILLYNQKLYDSNQPQRRTHGGK